MQIIVWVLMAVRAKLKDIDDEGRETSMTNYDLWDGLSKASIHVLDAIEQNPASDACWNEAALQMFGAPLLSHKEVALHQLGELAERADRDGMNAEIGAGIRALRSLVEDGQAEGAYWLMRMLGDKALRDSVYDKAPLPVNATL